MPTSVADPDPGSSAFLTTGSGSGISDKHLASYFRELSNNISDKKNYKILCCGSGLGSRHLFNSRYRMQYRSLRYFLIFSPELMDRILYGRVGSHF